MELLRLTTFRKIEMSYTAHAIDQQSCKDHNGLILGEEVIKRVKELPVVKEMEGYAAVLMDSENSYPAPTLTVIGMLIDPVVRKDKDGVNKSVLASISVKVHTVTEVEVETYFNTPGLNTLARTTKVRNQYGLLVDHLVDACNAAIKSAAHFIKTGEQLRNELS